MSTDNRNHPKPLLSQRPKFIRSKCKPRAANGGKYAGENRGDSLDSFMKVMHRLPNRRKGELG